MTLREDEAREGLLGLIDQLTTDEESPTAQLVTAGALQDLLPRVLQDLVDAARGRGASWQDVATARGLKTASSAHWHYGRGRPAGEDAPPATKKDRLQDARVRAADNRKPTPPLPDLPGLSRQDAAAQLGCDPKTLVRRAGKRDGVRVEEFALSGRKPVRRYFLL